MRTDYLKLRIFLSGWCIICGAAVIFGQHIQRLDDMLNRPELEGSLLALCILDSNGEILFTQNASIPMIPASTQKLVTTLVAMDQLGLNYSYETVVGYQGELLPDGSLYGDVVIIGSGDPSLGAPEFKGSGSWEGFLDKVVQMVAAAGIRCVEGEIVLYTGIFEPEAVHDSWSWDDLGNYYAAGTWGINAHQNMYSISFARSVSPGNLTRIVAIDPEIPALTLRNEVITGAKGSGDQAYIYGDPYGVRKNIRGTIPPGKGNFTIKGAIPHPPLFLGHHIKKKLEGKTVHVGGIRWEANRGPDQDFRKLGSIQSAPLFDMIKWANTESNNLFCDSFLKKLGAERQREGSYRNGVEAIEKVLRDLDGELPEAIRLKDGSGLSWRNRVTAYGMSRFLYTMCERHDPGVIKGLIPRVGDPGMSYFLKRTEHRDRLWLKSGSMASVLGYAGIFQVSAGEHYYISLMSNGHSLSNSKMRVYLEDIFELILDKYLE